MPTICSTSLCIILCKMIVVKAAVNSSNMTESAKTDLTCTSNYTHSVTHNFPCKIIQNLLVLYRLPYFSHVVMSDYFTFQTTDISIRCQLLQIYNKSYKIVSKLANLLQLFGSIMSRMYKNYFMLISRYCSLRIYRY